MASNEMGWIWSEEHGRYYRKITNPLTGEINYHWAAAAESSTVQQPTASTLQVPTVGSVSMSRQRSDSVGPDPNMAPAASDNIRNRLRFQGTPDRGWYETLDNRYRMRTRGEANQFFKIGRVFAMLWAEAASETMVRRAGGTDNTAITVGRFGQNVFSQIRRFVIVQVNREAHFVYALAISTYGGRGVTKPGCRASEHTIVYLNGTQPIAFQSELERGMDKEPIMIDPTNPSETMESASRLRCGKIYSIEWNVKVRDIGMVSGNDKTRLKRYFSEEQNRGFDPDDDDDDDDDNETPGYQQPTVAYPSNPYLQSHSQTQYGTNAWNY